MSEIKIRHTIPDAWAEHGRCPNCAAAGLRVLHPVNRADQLLCAACGLSFELEMEGARLHVCHWPDTFPELNIIISDEWRTAAELRVLIQKLSSEAAVSAEATNAFMPEDLESRIQSADLRASMGPVPQPPPPTADAADLARRIQELRQLGNTPKQILTSLTREEKDPERLQTIQRLIAPMETQEQARQGQRQHLSLVVVGVLLVLVVAGGIILTLLNTGPASRSSSQANGMAGTPTPGARAPQALVDLLNLSTPVVKYGGAPSSGSQFVCPHTTAQAAGMFGGVSEDWISPPNTHGWIMISKGGPAKVTLPAGVKAVYLEWSDRLKQVEVDGPASMNGVYYLYISCP